MPPRVALLALVLLAGPLVTGPPAAAQSFTWRSAAGPSAAIGQLHVYADGSVLGVSGGLLYRPPDDGLTWQRVASAPDEIRALRVSGARVWVVP